MLLKHMSSAVLAGIVHGLATAEMLGCTTKAKEMVIMTASLKMVPHASIAPAATAFRCCDRQLLQRL